MNANQQPNAPLRSPSTDWHVWQDSDVAAKFANDRRGGILGAADQLEVMQQHFASRRTDAHGVIDLGCGDGILLERLLTGWPEATGVALDGSPPMLDRARERLARFGDRVRYVEADFNDTAWRDALPAGEYAAVVSGFAIHHSEDDRKRALYAEIYGLLSPGGLFVNIEHVASASPLGEELFERAYAMNITRMRRAQGNETSFETVYAEIHDRLDKAANRLTPVQTQLDWLREIGFVDVDCYWKYYELAIIAGYR